MIILNTSKLAEIFVLTDDFMQEFRDGKLITSLSSKIGTLYFFMKIALYSRKIT